MRLHCHCARGAKPPKPQVRFELTAICLPSSRTPDRAPAASISIAPLQKEAIGKPKLRARQDSNLWRIETLYRLARGCNRHSATCPYKRARRDSNSRGLAPLPRLQLGPFAATKLAHLNGGRRRHRTSRHRGATCLRGRLQSRLVAVRNVMKGWCGIRTHEGARPFLRFRRSAIVRSANHPYRHLSS